MVIGDTYSYSKVRERKGEERGAYVMLSSVMAFTRMVIGGAILFSDCSAWMVPIIRQCLPCGEEAYSAMNFVYNICNTYAHTIVVCC